jgi:hypothetical protein
MQLWTQFYAAIGAASAALLGLLFVAISINVSAAIGPEEPVSRRLTEQAFQNYLAVMMLAFVALFPGIKTTTFGWWTLVATASSSVWVVVRLCQTFSEGSKERSWIYAVRGHMPSLIGFGILLVSALRMALNWGEALNLLAASTLVLLFSATAVSWELLWRIAKHKSR